MSEEALFPGYIPREEGQEILREAARVHQDGRSRALLLYGSGGVGKTSLVRRLATENAGDPTTVWVDPVDIDDSEYWLLSDFERHVADQLDPRNSYFAEYRKYLAELPAYTRRRIGYETVLSHLSRVKQVFTECYSAFVASGKTVVIALDTVEVMRGLYLLQTLTQWMKDLPGTLFVLAGRPPRDGREDPIRNELSDPHRPLPVRTVWLSEFTPDAAIDYLNRSGVASGLSGDEMAKLVLLTDGHPLWLAFTVDYLKHTGLPAEAAGIGLAALRAQMSPAGTAPSAGQVRREEFKRRLVAPYNESDFWHEALRRLAVVREGVSYEVWEDLMADRALPSDAPTSEAAWERLRQIPWIRRRASGRCVTLHDAVAEELALWLIPMHDQGKHWRHALWARAEAIFARKARELDEGLEDERARLDEALHSWGARLVPGQARLPAGAETELIEDAGKLEARKRELSQLKTAQLHYRLLRDFPGGCELFLTLMEEARTEHHILFQNLLAVEMERFLPGGPGADAPGDTVGETIAAFRDWLGSESGRRNHLAVGISLADHLIRAERPQAAIALLERLPERGAGLAERYRLSNLRGNAWMRVKGRFHDALPHFDEALIEAGGLAGPERLRLVAKAYKELGFYHRNAGKWAEADNSYREARDAISQTLLEGGDRADREEMASIQSNWAYVKGLTGDYRAGVNLAQSAIAIRHKLGNYREEGNSWSVLGEVYRYERRFEKAWESYAEAERIFQRLRNWAWLGLIHQEQAICLFQALQDGITLAPEPMAEAKRLITVALDLCRDLSVRAYPSALNRAGRIYGAEDADAGLAFLAEGIEEGYRLSDGWFWFANMVEHAELSYRTWAATGRQDCYGQIRAHEAGIAQAMVEYEFPDLKGRWKLLQGHLIVRAAIATGDESGLGEALEYYQDGFLLISQEYVGSSGAAAVAAEFKTLGDLIQDLPGQTRVEWQTALRRAWSQEKSAATLLLAGLEQLY